LAALRGEERIGLVGRQRRARSGLASPRRAASISSSDIDLRAEQALALVRDGGAVSIVRR
jgi:hypothetical protein